MKIESADTKERVIKRLRRIEGQVRGLQKMMAEERDCREIFQQFTAIHSALQSASRLFLQEYASACLSALDEEAAHQPAAEVAQRRDQVLKEMIAFINKAP